MRRPVHAPWDARTEDRPQGRSSRTNVLPFLRPPDRWPLRRPEARFSELIRRVPSERRRPVTVHGHEEVVVVSPQGLVEDGRKPGHTYSVARSRHRRDPTTPASPNHSLTSTPAVFRIADLDGGAAGSYPITLVAGILHIELTFISQGLYLALVHAGRWL
jgi:hypothetical protein